MGVNVGQVTGQEIGTYRGLENVRMLQVELLGSNPDTVLFFNVSGEDTAPANGDMVIVRNMGGFRMTLGTKDPILQVSNAGEKEFYSHAAGVKLARLKLNIDGSVGIKNQISGIDFATAMTELIDEIKALTTFGSPTNHVVTAASKALIQVKLIQLLTVVKGI
ncbi:MAG: hypothetical protein GWP06_00345 [Actinobacteria bacterium]|nr:hypothetical protein [Actinomycetota bacterium]